MLTTASLSMRRKLDSSEDIQITGNALCASVRKIGKRRSAVSFQPAVNFGVEIYAHQETEGAMTLSEGRLQSNDHCSDM